MVNQVKIKFRRQWARVWDATDPILDAGEPGVELDTGRFKLGDGLSRWSQLPFFGPGANEGGDVGITLAAFQAHIEATSPHPAYDDGPSLTLLYQNSKV